jgi:hypothetical protein
MIRIIIVAVKWRLARETAFVEHGAEVAKVPATHFSEEPQRWRVI